MKVNIKYLRIIFILSVLMNVFLGYKVIKAKYFRYDPDYTYNRKDLFGKLKVNIDSSSIVFIGNSLTQQFEVAELFKNIHIRNRGINGDNSSGILNRLTEIIESHPKKIFIESGVNDIKDGTGKEKLLINYREILSRLQQESNTSKLYVQSILPVNKKGAAIVATGIKNETIREVNKDLEEYCNIHGITFIDLYSHFELNGEMNPKYCIADGLHISGDGYFLWTKILDEYVNK